MFNKNISDDKIYAQTYQKFKNQVKLPWEYIKTMGESKYFNHFYSQEVIDTVMRKWS